MIAIAKQGSHIELIEACKKGDSRAEFELYTRYSKALYNSCLRIVGRAEVAEDLLQDTFVNIFSKIHTYSDQYSFYTWSKRIAINLSINHQNKRSIDYSLDEDVHAYAITDESPDEEGTNHSVEEIHRAMMQLPDGYREIFSLYLIEGYDHGEIAEILGISTSTSKSQYSRAKAKLKELIKQNRHARRSV
ncbi:RNA polymerase sigma factor [bacterium]|nr:RNA polymerase sigma factor [bacterium]